MSNQYISSRISKYGDESSVKQDVKTLNDILSRQGTSLLIDVIAEYVGYSAINYNLSKTERNTLVESLVTELKNSLQERV